MSRFPPPGVPRPPGTLSRVKSPGESDDTPAPSRPRLTRTLVLIGITSLLTDLSSEMVYPLLPFLVVGTLGASVTLLGVIEGLAESLPSLVKVYSGRMSDRTGKRKSLALAGYSCSVAGKIFLSLASGWTPVLAGRVVDRLGKGIRSAPRDALIADTTPHEHRGHAYGFHKAMDTSGAFLGVLAAYIILTTVHESGLRPGQPLRIALYASLVPAIIAVVALALIREPAAPARNKPVSRPILSAWSVLPARLRLFVVISFVFSLAGSTNQFLLLRAQQLLVGKGESPLLSAATVCLFYLVYNLTYAAASYPFGRLSDSVGRKPVLLAGYSLYAAIYAAFAVNQSPGWCWALFALYGLFPALTEGVEKALVSDLAPRELRATALGLHGTVQALGLFPASVIGGLLWDGISPAATFWFAAITGAVAVGGLALMPLGPSARRHGAG